MELETLLVRSGGGVEPVSGDIAPPIHLSTTFQHGPAGEDLSGHTYIRVSNPTQDRLENALAQIEGGSSALFFSSGMAAGVAYLQSLPVGSHVLFHNDVYFGFREAAESFFAGWGLQHDAVDMNDAAAVRDSIRPNTALLWAETPSNPMLEILDLALLAKTAHAAGAKLLVDGTFATPALQRPLLHGADIVLHAATKYMGGHSDVQGGALIFKEQGPQWEKVHEVRTLLGAVGSPFNAWLVLRGLRSLACRMERHSSNALAVAQWLERQPAVEQVFYPGLPSHPGHAAAERQMAAPGGMLSFTVRGGREAAIAVAARLRLFIVATSLGGVESLIEHRASSEGPDSKTPGNLLRVSVGIESARDLIADLDQALNQPDLSTVLPG